MAEQLINPTKDFTLAAGISSSTTTITVNESGFPNTPNFRIRVDNELMLVTGSASPWTVTRGIEGTTPVLHAINAVVSIVATAGGLVQWWSEMLAGTPDATFDVSGLAGGADGQVLSKVAGIWTPVDDAVTLLPSIPNSFILGDTSIPESWIEHSFPAQPRRRSYLGWTLNPTLNGGGTGFTSGTTFLASVEVDLPGTITTVSIPLTNLGTGTAPTFMKIGLYRLRASSNTADLFALSGDLSANFFTGGPAVGTRDIAVTQQAANAGAPAGSNSMDVVPTDVVYAAGLCVSTGVVPQIGVGVGSPGPIPTNMGLALPDFKSASLTAQTSLPATLDFSTLTQLGTTRIFGIK